MGLNLFLKQITFNNSLKTIRNPKYFFQLLEYLKVREYNKLFFEKQEYKKFITEIEHASINQDIEKKLTIFSNIKGKTISGHDFGSGIISKYQAHNLYCILRKTRPDTVVETGVCNGFSSAFILQSLEKNKRGKLYSIDLPEIEGETYGSDSFWEGKGGAVVPKGKESGWLIPDDLRSRWKLILGKTQDELPKLVEKLSSIDIFIHDSEHSYETMSFEYNRAWPKLKKGGILFSHDIQWNRAFFDFAEKKGRKPYYVDYTFGFLIK